jgi:hypothetical protein
MKYLTPIVAILAGLGAAHPIVTKSVEKRQQAAINDGMDLQAYQLFNLCLQKYS